MSNMLLNNKELAVLNEFASNQRYHGRRLANKLNMNQKTVSNVLNILEKKNFIKFTQEGKNKNYFLNKSNLLLKEALKLVEINRKIIFLEKYSKLNELFLKIEKRSKGLVLVFGSYANFSSTKNSDFDLFIIGSVNELDDLEKLYHLKINIVNSSKTKFKRDDLFVKEILKNHIILKGVENFIELIW